VFACRASESRKISPAITRTTPSASPVALMSFLRNLIIFIEPATGFEPATFPLQGDCSAKLS
jgi:hypothetical protein